MLKIPIYYHLYKKEKDRDSPPIIKAKVELTYFFVMKSILASVLLFSALVTVTPVFAQTTESNKDQLTNEASGMCWTGRINCGSL
jgi:hypothetical protein